MSVSEIRGAELGSENRSGYVFVASVVAGEFRRRQPRVLIKFVGTHAEYERIDPEMVASRRRVHRAAAE